MRTDVGEAADQRHAVEHQKEHPRTHRISPSDHTPRLPDSRTAGAAIHCLPAARSISSATVPDFDTRDTWLAAISIVWAPIRLAKNRCSFGSMASSLVDT